MAFGKKKELSKEERIDLAHRKLASAQNMFKQAKDNVDESDVILDGVIGEALAKIEEYQSVVDRSHEKKLRNAKFKDQLEKFIELD